MSKIDLQNITVLNYNENDVFVDSSKEHYKFNASRDGINPTMQDIPISELQYICSNTDIFVTGWLTFNEDEKEEIFTALRVFNLGDYIEWQGQMWLVTRLDPDDKANHSGYMYLCTVPLRWQNSEGKIIERFAYSEDFTKYSAGTTGNNFLVI